jgi:hypothetical protein
MHHAQNAEKIITKSLADDFLGFLAFFVMPGGDAPSPRPPLGLRSPKKRTPIDLSVSAAKTNRGFPTTKLKQQSILLSMLVGGEAMIRWC